MEDVSTNRNAACPARVHLPVRPDIAAERQDRRREGGREGRTEGEREGGREGGREGAREGGM
jgi:hypothetical protein